MNRKMLFFLILTSLFFLFSCGIPNPYYVTYENEPKFYSLPLTPNSNESYYITVTEEFKSVSSNEEPQLYLFYTIEPSDQPNSSYYVSYFTSRFRTLYGANPNTNNIPNTERPFSITQSLPNSTNENITLSMNRFTNALNGNLITSFSSLIPSSSSVPSSLRNPYMWEISIEGFNENPAFNSLKIIVNSQEYEVKRYNGNGFAPGNGNSSYIGNEIIGNQIPHNYATLRIWAVVTTGNFKEHTGSFNVIKNIANFNTDDSSFEFF